MEIIDRLHARGFFILAQVIHWWQGLFPIWKRTIEIELVGHNAEVQDNYILELIRVVLCLSQGGNSITWGAVLHQGCAEVAEMYMYILTTKHSLDNKLLDLENMETEGSY